MFTLFVPVFNGENTIHETLTSLARQSVRNITIVVLDNGSTDRTENIVRNFDDERLHYLRYEHTPSLGESLNRAFDIPIHTDFFSICHADDIYHPDYVKIMGESLNKYKDSDILFCPARIIDSEGRALKSLYNTLKTLYLRMWPKYSGVLGVMRLLIWNSLIAPSAAFRKSGIGRFPKFSPVLVYYTDVYFWTRFLTEGGNIRVGRVPLIRYRVHLAQKSTTSRNLENQFKELDCLSKGLLDNKSVKPYLIKWCVRLSKLYKYIDRLILRSMR